MTRGRKRTDYDLNSSRGRWRNTAPGVWERGKDSHDSACVRKVEVGAFHFWTGTVGAHWGAKPIPRFVGQDQPQYWDTAKQAMAGVDAWMDAALSSAKRGEEG